MITNKVQALRRVLKAAHAQGIKTRTMNAWASGDMTAEHARAILKRHGQDVTATEFRLMRAADAGERVWEK